jgi:hypothetical protein
MLRGTDEVSKSKLIGHSKRIFTPERTSKTLRLLRLWTSILFNLDIILGEDLRSYFFLVMVDINNFIITGICLLYLARKNL